jgi:putative ABC transport system ATP-binding protein
MSEAESPVPLEIQGLSLEFGPRRLWHDLTLTLGAGEKIALTGKSGGGKSSLLKCILGLVAPSAGSVLIRGARLDSKTVWSARQFMGYVPQEPDLGDLTALDFLRKPFRYRANHRLEWDEELLRELCDAFHLDEGLLSQPSHRLSGGEKQRVALISALMLRRGLYLFDEITSALDEEARAAVAGYFKEASGMTAVFVAHDRELRAVCDRVYSLSPTGALRSVS